MRNNDLAIKRGRFFCNPGSPVHIVLGPELLEDGTIKLSKIGEENTDEIIASYYESTTLECILSKFANGDLSALNRYQPIYMDVTTAPKTLAEAQQKLINMENAFLALPSEVKEQFGNSFNVWISKAGSEEWMKHMSKVMNTNIKDDNNSAPTERSESAAAEGQS